MEQKQDNDFYLPFAAPSLIEASELMESALEPAGNYDAIDESQRALLVIFSKIFEVSENFTGPIFLPQGSRQNNYLPPKWQAIINYLKEEKIIDDVFFARLFNDEPKLIRTSATAVLDDNFSNLTDGSKPMSASFTHGDSTELDEALSKSIGELLERHLLLFYKEKDLLRASSQDLAAKSKLYLDPRDLAGFSEQQKARNANFQFDKKTEFLWKEAKSLFTGKNFLLPAQLVFWTYNRVHQNWREPLLREQNTNGAGAHYTLTKAILAGLYEIIQRDGFLIYWLNKQGPPQINLETINYEPLKKLLAECQRLDLEVHFYNTTTELGIPSCICSIFDHSGVGPKISFGGGCEMDWNKALLRSLVEGIGVYHWIRSRWESGGAGPLNLSKDYQPFQDYSMGQIERLDLMGNEKMFGHFQFFLQGETQSLDELKEKIPKFFSSDDELNYLIEKFKSLGKGYEIFYYQVNHKVLSRLNYCVVKVVVPALVYLYLREVYAPLGAKRLKEIPEKLGFRPAKEWNPIPHLFP